MYVADSVTAIDGFDCNEKLGQIRMEAMYA